MRFRLRGFADDSLNAPDTYTPEIQNETLSVTIAFFGINGPTLPALGFGAGNVLHSPLKDAGRHRGIAQLRHCFLFLFRRGGVRGSREISRQRSIRIRDSAASVA
jgi:hypothetical protein